MAKGKFKRFLEFMLVVMAMSFVIWQAIVLQQRSEQGTARWQADVSSALPIGSNLRQALTDSWCRRDIRFHAVLAEIPEIKQSCGTRLAAVFHRWFPSSESPLSADTNELNSALVRWQNEIDRRAQSLRESIADVDRSKVSVALLSEMALQTSTAANEQDESVSSSEKALLQSPAAEEVLQRQTEANERLGSWNQMVMPVLAKSSAAQKDPLAVARASAMWASAKVLDGRGSDEAARTIKQWLETPRLAERGQQSIVLFEKAPFLLGLVGVVTWLMVLAARAGVHPADRTVWIVFLSSASWAGLAVVGAIPPIKDNPGLFFSWIALGIIAWVFARWRRKEAQPYSAHLPLSIWVVPGWLLFTGIGWLLLLDLSLNFHPRLRFLALDHWRAWLVSSVMLAVASIISAPLLNMLSRIGAFFYRGENLLKIAVRVLLCLLVIAAFAVLHAIGIPQQVTGELMKLLFVLAISWWCVWKLPLASMLWHNGWQRMLIRPTVSLVLVFVTMLVVALVTSDRGPLLVIGLVLTVVLSSMTGWLSGIIVVLIGFALLFFVGMDLDVVGSRLQAWHDPFSADHDDMARLFWFQQKASESTWGFGVGQVPWCGQGNGNTCRGLPLQLQSDYSFTALTGWWGPSGAWTLVTLYTWMCFRTISVASKQAVKVMQPLALALPGVTAQALKWTLLLLVSSLLLLQTWTTVAGNLGWIPLTGITWPLLSHGKISLWVSTLLFGALALKE